MARGRTFTTANPTAGPGHTWTLPGRSAGKRGAARRAWRSGVRRGRRGGRVRSRTAHRGRVRADTRACSGEQSDRPSTRRTFATVEVANVDLATPVEPARRRREPRGAFGRTCSPNPPIDRRDARVVCIYEPQRAPGRRRRATGAAPPSVDAPSAHAAPNHFRPSGARNPKRSSVELPWSTTSRRRCSPDVERRGALRGAAVTYRCRRARMDAALHGRRDRRRRARGRRSRRRPSARSHARPRRRVGRARADR